MSEIDVFGLCGDGQPVHSPMAGEVFHRWHAALSGVTAALCEAGYPCHERHEHDEIPIGEIPGDDQSCWVFFDGDLPPREVMAKACELCGVEDLWQMMTDEAELWS